MLRSIAATFELRRTEGDDHPSSPDRKKRATYTGSQSTSQPRYQVAPRGLRPGRPCPYRIGHDFAVRLASTARREGCPGLKSSPLT